MESMVAQNGTQIAAKPLPASNKRPAVTNKDGKDEVPVCLRRLVRTIVRSFYARELSLIVDILVRNTIMSEDELCERLRFDKKMLRQHLHTLRLDQFIQSKLQLETDADGKTAKIIHYFIDYKLFVNVVKYKLDHMQRRLEAGQRHTSSRASFKCPSCQTTYTDLEVDRLVDPLYPGRLACVYCHAEVAEEEDSASRVDARAMVAKFHHQIRNPVDKMLKECDSIHLSSAILEPEIRPHQSLESAVNSATNKAGDPGSQLPDSGNWTNDATKCSENSKFGATENRLKIEIIDRGGSTTGAGATKERPVWMSESTVHSGPTGGLGELDRGAGNSFTQTLAPGRVPVASSGGDTQASGSSLSGSGSGAGLAGADGLSGTGSSNTSSGSSHVGDIMQLLLVHERRGLGSHGPKSAPQSQSSSSSSGNKSASSSSATGGNSGVALSNQKLASSGSSGNLVPNDLSSGAGKDVKDGNINEKNSTSGTGDGAAKNNDAEEQTDDYEYTVTINGRRLQYSQITPSMVQSMRAEEKQEYIRVGKLVYSDMMFD